MVNAKDIARRVVVTLMRSGVTNGPGTSVYVTETGVVVTPDVSGSITASPDGSNESDGTVETSWKYKLLIHKSAVFKPNCVAVNVMGETSIVERSKLYDKISGTRCDDDTPEKPAWPSSFKKRGLWVEMIHGENDAQFFGAIDLISSSSAAVRIRECPDKVIARLDVTSLQRNNSHAIPKLPSGHCMRHGWLLPQRRAFLSASEDPKRYTLGC